MGKDLTLCVPHVAQCFSFNLIIIILEWTFQPLFEIGMDTSIRNSTPMGMSLECTLSFKKEN